MLSNTFSFDDVYDLSEPSVGGNALATADKLARLEAMFLDNTTSKSNTDITGSVKERDTVGRSVFRNYAREYVL